MPDVRAEVRALLGWGLLVRPPGEAAYAATYLVPTPVRRWARAGMGDLERGRLLRPAAAFWMGTRRESGDLADFLQARHYWFQAGEYERADEITYVATEPLSRLGQIELLLRLLNESVRTLSGNSRAVALGNLAGVYQRLGERQAARQITELALAEFQETGSRAQVAVALTQLGTLHKAQGEYGPARECYDQSLVIAQELGDRAGVASVLGQLGLLCEREGDLAAAVRSLAQALVLFERLGAPERELARQSLARLRETMGE